jgi:hypothetical protein
MKKSELRQLIREEISKILKEENNLLESKQKMNILLKQAKLKTEETKKLMRQQGYEI